MSVCLSVCLSVPVSVSVSVSLSLSLCLSVSVSVSVSVSLSLSLSLPLSLSLSLSNYPRKGTKSSGTVLNVGVTADRWEVKHCSQEETKNLLLPPLDWMSRVQRTPATVKPCSSFLV